MCAFEELFHAAAAPSHQEAGTTLKTAAQDGSSPVQHTQVCGKTPGGTRDRTGPSKSGWVSYCVSR